MILSRIPEKVFESVGVVIGFIGPILISLQIRAEWLSQTPSSLSPAYLAGFLLVYFFWFLYGVRFNRFAVWFGNFLGVVLQTILLILVLLK
jgi:uncharacterized protein with PQ loop repeat